ncbi:maturin isoform X1 [Arvicanthis niloticus]|uniref:maturin isoform X1 n=1 Tax=Arvicanthis niloticus TaxID=61156 RepID=UPI00402B2B48
MDFQQLADVAEKWCASTPFELIAAEETECRMDFYADPGVSFYVLCPDNGCGDSFHVWSESEDCLPFLQLAQDYISSCGKKTLHEVLEKVFKSFRPKGFLPENTVLILDTGVKETSALRMHPVAREAGRCHTRKSSWPPCNPCLCLCHLVSSLEETKDSTTAKLPKWGRKPKRKIFFLVHVALHE